MPRSQAQIDASRRNGARSRGPRTAEGRARSSQNARTHGLRARTAPPLQGGDAARCAQLAGIVRERLRPSDPVEEAICRRIAEAGWRLDRTRRLETAFWNEGRAGLDPDAPLRLLQAFHRASRTRSLDTIGRYQASADAALARAYRDLARYRRPVRSQRTARTNPSPARPSADAPAARSRTTEPGPARPTSAAPDPGQATAPRTNEPDRPLNRHQRRALAARSRPTPGISSHERTRAPVPGLRSGPERASPARTTRKEAAPCPNFST